MLNIFIELRGRDWDKMNIGIVLVNQENREKETIKNVIAAYDIPFDRVLRSAVRDAIDIGLCRDSCVRVILPDHKHYKIFKTKTYETIEEQFFKVVYVSLDQLKKNKYYQEAERIALEK